MIRRSGDQERRKRIRERKVGRKKTKKSKTHYSIIQLLHYSIIQLFQYSIPPLFGFIR